MKRNNIIAVLFLAFTAISFAACKQKCNCGNFTFDDLTYFKIKKDGVTLNDSNLVNTKLYFISNDVEDDYLTAIENENLMRATASSDEKWKAQNIAIFERLSTLNLYYKISEFYFKYPDGDIDTLWIRADNVSEENAATEDCKCMMPIREMKFNGKEVKRDKPSPLTNEPVFLFED